MALKKPLVIDAGQIEQLQAGDTIDTGGGIQTLTNGNGGSIVIGNPVYASTNDTVDLARANASGTKDVIGLVSAATITSGATGAILVDDGSVLSATTGQWDTVTGGSGGLTAGTTYFLDPSTAGGLTPTAPTSVGQFVCPVGIALSTTEFKLDIGTTVLL